MNLLEVDIPLPYADHAFGTRFDDNPNTEETIRAFSEAIGPIAHMRQVHGDRIAYAYDAGVYEEADAIYTDNPDVWLAVKTADCVPVLVSCPHAVAAVHCGWRGLEAELLPKVIKKLEEEYDITSNDIFVHIGPCIQKHIYEVEEHFKNLFDDQFFSPSPNKGKVLMDLPGIVTDQARQMGVPQKHIVDTGLCTYSESELFHSYRRAKEEGQKDYQVQLSLVRLQEK